MLFQEVNLGQTDIEILSHFYDDDQESICTYKVCVCN